MGERLRQCYALVTAERGPDGPRQLQRLTRVPPEVAVRTPDTAEQVRDFTVAVAELVGRLPPV